MTPARPLLSRSPMLAARSSTRLPLLSRTATPLVSTAAVATAPLPLAAPVLAATRQLPPALTQLALPLVALLPALLPLLPLALLTLPPLRKSGSVMNSMCVEDNINAEVEVLAVHLLRLLLPPTQLRELPLRTSVKLSTNDSLLAPVLLALPRPLRVPAAPLLRLPLTARLLILLLCLLPSRSLLLALPSLVVLPLFFKDE